MIVSMWSLHRIENGSLTWFTLSAAARCVATAASILLEENFSVVSVYDDFHREMTVEHEECFSHLVHFQCSSQTPRNSSTDVQCKVQCCECLKWVRDSNVNKLHSQSIHSRPVRRSLDEICFMGGIGIFPRTVVHVTVK
jgi:hypothetical protein